MCPPTGKPEEGGGAGGPLAGTKRQTLFFTATWPKSVQQTADAFTARDAIQVSIGQGATGDKLTCNPKVKQTVIVMDEEEKFEKLKEILSEMPPGQTAIVFAGMKAICDKLVTDLQKTKLGLWCRTIHSGKDQWVRDESLQTFKQMTMAEGGQRAVLVATDVAARGIDIPGVYLVVVYDFGRALHSGQNGGVEGYVHRIGRTGRAGKSGRAFTFFTRQDRGAWELCELLRGANQEVPAALADLSWSERRPRAHGFASRKGKGKGKSRGSWGAQW